MSPRPVTKAGANVSNTPAMTPAVAVPATADDDDRALKEGVGGQQVVLTDELGDNGRSGRIVERADRSLDKGDAYRSHIRSAELTARNPRTRNALVRSEAIITRLRSQRSTSTPAKSPNKSWGSATATAVVATAAVDPVSL